MDILKTNQKSKLIKRQSIFWDVDDVIINTSEIIVDILNERYLLPHGMQPKSFKDIKDWGFKSIYQRLSEEELMNIFESEEFWERVQITDNFNNILNNKKIMKKYNHYLVTKGTDISLLKKKDFIEKAFKDKFENFEFIGLESNCNKAVVDMRDGIQIDDNVYNLNDTNARLKVLITNGIETEFNDVMYYRRKGPNNLYIIQNLKEFEEILEFNADLDNNDKLGYYD